MDKNREFETVLDECVELLLTGEGTIDQCLERYPQYAEELKPLLITISTVNNAVDVKPSEEFKKRAHYQMQLKMAESAPKRRSFWSLQPKWAIATMAVMFVFLLGGGTVLAANSSMPGSPLYPIKIAGENVSLLLARSDIKKAEIYAAIAQRRVDEMVYVVENNKISYAQGIAQNYDKTMSAIDALPLSTDHAQVLSSSVSSSFGATMATENATQESTEPQMALAPPSTQSTDKGATPSTTAATTTIPVVTSVPAPNITVDVPGSRNASSGSSDVDKLKQYIAFNAINHPEKLLALLDKAPESIKPLIRQMIMDAAQDNIQILEKLGE